MSGAGHTRSFLQRESLTALVRTLGDGSRCFCCGAVMRAPAQAGGGGRGMARDVAAVCAECGSEVGVVAEPASEDAGEVSQPHSTATRGPMSCSRGSFVAAA